MKAEQRKALEKNELAQRLNKAWDGVSSTSNAANRIWVGLLVLFIAGVALYLYSQYSANRNASLWSTLDFAPDEKSLQKIVEDSPDSTPGHIARFHIARVKLQDATSRIGARASDDRASAADTLESVRKTYQELANISGLPNLLVQEAMLQRAKVEEMLASVPKADSGTEMRGKLDTAAQYYADLAKKFPKTYAGEQAAKRSEELKTKRAEIEKLYSDLAKDHAKSPAEPALPNLPPLSPPAPTPP